MGQFVRAATQRNVKKDEGPSRQTLGNTMSQKPKPGGLQGFAEGVGNFRQGIQNQTGYTGMQNAMGNLRENVNQYTGMNKINEMGQNAQNSLFSFMQGGQKQNQQNDAYLDDIINTITGMRGR